MTHEDSSSDSSLAVPAEGSSLRQNVDLDESAVAVDKAKHPDTLPAVRGDAGGARLLIDLTRWRPFIGLFLFLADCNFPASMPPHERVRGMRAEHPWWYRMAVTLDGVWLIAILVFVAYVAVRVAGSALA